MLKPTTRYIKQTNGKYLLAVSYRGKTFSLEIDKLPFSSIAPQFVNIYTKVKGEDTIFEQVSDRLFKLKLNNQQVEDICRKLKNIKD